MSERQPKAVANDTKQTTTNRRGDPCGCPHFISNLISASAPSLRGQAFFRRKKPGGVFYNLMKSVLLPQSNALRSTAPSETERAFKEISYKINNL